MWNSPPFSDILLSHQFSRHLPYFGSLLTVVTSSCRPQASSTVQVSHHGPRSYEWFQWQQCQCQPFCQRQHSPFCSSKQSNESSGRAYSFPREDKMFHLVRSFKRPSSRILMEIAECNQKPSRACLISISSARERILLLLESFTLLVVNSSAKCESSTGHN